MWVKIINQTLSYAPKSIGNISNPNAATLAAAGYEDLSPEEIAALLPVPEENNSVKRYSRIKLHDAIGHEAWMNFVAQLSEVQQYRLSIANELATDDAAFAEALESFVNTVPNAAAILAVAEVM